MSFEGRCDANWNCILARDIVHEPGQIALEMQAESQEIRQHEDLFGACRGQRGNGLGKAGRRLEERGLIEIPSAFVRRFRCYYANGFVGGCHTRAVSEY